MSREKERGWGNVMEPLSDRETDLENLRWFPAARRMALLVGLSLEMIRGFLLGAMWNTETTARPQ
jgi:hypothetical protein